MPPTIRRFFSSRSPRPHHHHHHTLLLILGRKNIVTFLASGSLEESSRCLAPRTGGSRSASRLDMGRKNKKNRKRKGAPEESSSTATVSAADAESESLPVVGTTLQATDDVDPSGTNGLDLKPSSKNTRKRNRAGSSFVSAAEDDGGKSADHADKSCSLVIAPQSKGTLFQSLSFRVLCKACFEADRAESSRLVLVKKRARGTTEGDKMSANGC